MTAEQEREELRRWYLSFVDSFRREAEELTPDARARIPTNMDLRGPLQITVFWTKNPEFQLVLVSRFKDWGDERIDICGPVQASDLVDSADEFLSDPRWKRKLPDSHVSYLTPLRHARPETLSDSLGDTLHHFLLLLQRSATMKLGNSTPLFGFQPWEGAWAWEVAGSVTRLERGLWLDLPLSAAREAPPRPAPVQPLHRVVHSLQEPPLRPGYAEVAMTVVYPPIVIGELPRPASLKDRVTGQYLSALSRFVIDEQLDGRRLLIRRDGVLVLAAGAGASPRTLFNLFLAIALFQGVEVEAVRDLDIGTGQVEEKTLQVQGWRIPNSAKTELMTNSLMPGQLPPDVARFEVGEETLRKSVQLATEALKRADAVEDLVTCLEARTHFRGGEYSQAFVLAWVVMERGLHQSWEMFLKGSRPEGSAAPTGESKLLGTEDLDRILRALRFAGQLEQGDFDTLMRLKTARNQFVHRGRAISKEEAEECLKLALDSAADYIAELADPESGNEGQ